MHYLELHLLSLGQGTVSVGLYGRVMDKYVLAAAFGFNEAKALLIVEPLDSPSRHLPVHLLPFALKANRCIRFPDRVEGVQSKAA